MDANALDKMNSYLNHMHVATHLLAHSTIYTNNKRASDYGNPFNNYGKKAFSQTDEDGLTFEIVKRLGIQKGVFAEFGVGNGFENNTLALAAAKWRGFWVGNEDLAFNPNPMGEEKVNFTYIQDFITRGNVLDLIRRGKEAISRDTIDLISIDLDGNDIYLVDEMLTNGIFPKILIVEYNAKFIPPIDWKIDYDDNNVWRHDDYMGASLMAYCNLLTQNGYFLVCCNSFSGSNAFFVKNEYRSFFPDVPDDIDRLWCAPMYLPTLNYGHPQSARVIEIIFRDLHKDVD